MPNQKTRKLKGGYGWLNRLTGKPSINNQLKNAQKKRNIASQAVLANNAFKRTRILKTSVANVVPGLNPSKPTQKQQLKINTEQKLKNIEEEFKSTVAEIQKEDPVQLASALGEIQNKIKSALTSNTSKEATVITITIGVGSAQLFIKIARFFASAMIVFCLLFPGFWPWTDAFLLAAREIFPNSNFTSTLYIRDSVKKRLGLQ